MRVRALQHVAFEGPAAIARWAAARGFALDTAHLYKNDPLPMLADFDMLAVMGGPMSVNDGAKFSWLSPELALVKEAIAAKKIVLGVCLGAQIIASALGARVYPNLQKEIGWYLVQKTSAAAPLEGLPAEFIAFHWHGETFDLPDGAASLAATPATPNQAFAFGERVLALQFHLEATEESVNALLENAADDIGTGPFEQQPDMIAAGLSNCSLMRPHLDRVLDNLTGFAREST